MKTMLRALESDLHAVLHKAELIPSAYYQMVRLRFQREHARGSSDMNVLFERLTPQEAGALMVAFQEINEERMAGSMTM